MSVTTDWIAAARGFLFTVQSSPARQFWLNWGVQAAVATFTFLAVLVALFVSLWPKIYRPRLRLVLRDPNGEKTYTTLDNFRVRVRLEDIRYYHLQVSNYRRRWSPATDVRVHVIRIEQSGPDGYVWLGDVPLRWRDEEGLPSVWQTLGPAIDCDLCSVGERNGFRLQLRYVPNSLEAYKQEKFTWEVWLQARSLEVDSEVLRFRISWDGVW